MKRCFIRKASVIAIVIMCVNALPPAVIYGQSADDLQRGIDQRNQAIAELETQIKAYQRQINSLGTQAVSLSATIASLDITQKKLAAQIKVTENQIAAKNLEIQKLGHEIANKQSAIDDDGRIIRQSFAVLGETGEQTLPAIVLGSRSVSDILVNFDRLGSLQKNLYGRIAMLNADKTALQSSQSASEKDVNDLALLRGQLNDQKQVVLSTTAEQRELLKETNASQATYEKVLASKRAEEAALQQEIENYETQLHLLVRASQIPHAGAGVLSWPLDSIYITQYFGNTSFATANPQIYNGKGHTGVDFRASIGTPVKAALSGVVVGMADTDQYPGCYSYGKWIMIRHENGLSTLYAHLSLSTTHIGDQVTTGQVVGYSGNTGYSTGPHLHFGVYATAGVVIKLFTGSQHCQGATIPIADFSAYLNPLSYL